MATFHAPLSSQKEALKTQAESLKVQGNQLFAKDKLGAAIDAYTEAITLCPSVPVYWTNRALCYKKRSEWANVMSDCRKALDLDKESVKAHYMLGLAHAHQKSFGEAIRELEKALELARSGKGGPNMVEEIWQELAKVKHSQWQGGYTIRSQKQSQLRDYLKQLMVADYESKKKSFLRTSGKQAVPPPNEPSQPFGLFGMMPSFLFPPNSSRRMSEEMAESARNPQSNDSLAGSKREEETTGAAVPEGEFSGTQPSMELVLSELEERHNEQMNTFENIFERATKSDQLEEVPEHLCCHITMDLFRDPVITPSGITYERSELMKHLSRGKKFDPVSRAPLEPEQVYPNLALRESVQSYLDEHGWAYQTTIR